MIFMAVIHVPNIFLLLPTYLKTKSILEPKRNLFVVINIVFIAFTSMDKNANKY